MRRTAHLAAVLTTLAIGLASCSSGSSSGAAFFSEGDTVASEEPTESNAQEASPTTDLQPCELLTPQDLAALDVPTEPKDEKPVGSARSCQWQKPHSDTPGRTVSVGIFDELSIDEVVSDTEPEPLTVGSHQAMRYRAGGTCAISIGVTQSSRVDVLGTSDGNKKRACKIAKHAAELVEQHLP